MKKPLILSLLLLPATVCLADVAVYHGAQVVKTTSLDDTDTHVDRFIEVIDLAKVVDPTKPVDLTNANLVTITLDVDKHKKTFFVGQPSAVVITQVQDSHGNHKASTVLAQAFTATDTATGVVTVDSFRQKGINGQVVINGTVPTALPRNLQGSASTVTTAGSSTTGTPPVTTAIPSALEEVKSTATLQLAASLASNDAGDSTLVPAVQRVKAALIASGFVEVTSAP